MMQIISEVEYLYKANCYLSSIHGDIKSFKITNDFDKKNGRSILKLKPSLPGSDSGLTRVLPDLIFLDPGQI